MATTCKLGEMLAFGTGLMRPILAAAQPSVTLAGYVGMNQVDCWPYDLLYEDAIVSIILTRSCDFDSLRNWLAQNHIIPGNQAYTTVSNELVDMINTGNFPRNPPYNPKKDKNKKEETVGAIIQDTKNLKRTTILSTQMKKNRTMKKNWTARNRSPHQKKNRKLGQA